MKKLVLFCVVIISLSTLSTYAQELRCRVNVTYSDIGNADKELFTEMRQNIQEFMNSTVWTEKDFEEVGKIEVRMNFRVKKQMSNKNFVVNLQIQSSRPVFNSTYSTPMFNHVEEDITIEYDENQTIEFSKNSFVSNLASNLGYYAYLILGIDADSFAPKGGTDYFQQCQQIASYSSSHSDNEWGPSTDKKNKYWLVENILNSTYAGYRNAMYLYHRQGLDVMADEPKKGREKILEALQELEQIQRVRPGAFLLTVFFYAKDDELINIFSEAMPDEKKLAVDLLKKLNPKNSSEYDAIMQE
ncbi:MAG: DUF4835 family protein [Bacteroidales bacterium]